MSDHRDPRAWLDHMLDAVKREAIAQRDRAEGDAWRRLALVVTKIEEAELWNASLGDWTLPPPPGERTPDTKPAAGS